jgi:hypothetical protein
LERNWVPAHDLSGDGTLKLPFGGGSAPIANETRQSP